MKRGKRRTRSTFGVLSMAIMVGLLASCAAPSQNAEPLTFADAQVNRLTEGQISALLGESSRYAERASRSQRRLPLVASTTADTATATATTIDDEKAVIRASQADAKIMSALFKQADAKRTAEATARAKVEKVRADAAAKEAARRALLATQAKMRAAAEAQAKAEAEARVKAEAAAEQAAKEEKRRREAAERAITGPNPTADENRALAQQMMLDAGFAATEWDCLNTLWTRESQFDEDAINPTSGASGIPQALPATKMGPGWEDNPKQQIAWGLGYIAKRYGLPCVALQHSDRVGWY